MWNFPDFSEVVDLPALSPGKHHLELQTQSALAAKEDLVGLANDAPPNAWPPAKKFWSRVLDVDLTVYPQGEPMVGEAVDPALDPVRNGGLAAEPVIIRFNKGRAQAVLQFKYDKLPVAISFDTFIKIGGQTFPGRGLWSTKASETQTSSGGDNVVDIDRPAADVTEAEVILKPDPGQVEDVASVDEVWGQEVVFKHVALRRQDVGQPVPAKFKQRDVRQHEPET
jgi:hypothetical protein